MANVPSGFMMRPTQTTLYRKRTNPLYEAVLTLPAFALRIRRSELAEPLRTTRTRFLISHVRKPPVCNKCKVRSKLSKTATMKAAREELVTFGFSTLVSQCWVQR